MYHRCLGGHTLQLDEENVSENVASELTKNNLFSLTHGVQLYMVAIQATTPPRFEAR
jgi:hypothetical protein